MRVDLATVLLRGGSELAEAERAMDVILDAAPSLEAALARPAADGATCALPLVARSLLAKLAEALKRRCRAGGGEAVKRAYGAALRLGADVGAPPDRFLGLLREFEGLAGR